MEVTKKTELIEHLTHFQNKLAKASGKAKQQYYRGVVEGLEAMAGIDPFANMKESDRRLFAKLDFLLSRFSGEMFKVIENPIRVWVDWEDGDGVPYILTDKHWYRIGRTYRLVADNEWERVETKLEFTGKLYGKYGEDVSNYLLPAFRGLKLLNKREESRLDKLFYEAIEAGWDKDKEKEIETAIDFLKEQGYTVQKKEEDMAHKAGG